MTDPLRPFTQAIRSLWKTRARGVASAADSSHAASGASSSRSGAGSKQTGRAGETLRTRLHSRISALDTGDRQKMRDTFIETVLLWELGEHLAPDPGLSEVVARVSEQLATNPALVDRLHELLLQLSDKQSLPR